MTHQLSRKIRIYIQYLENNLFGMSEHRTLKFMFCILSSLTPSRKNEIFFVSSFSHQISWDRIEWLQYKKVTEDKRIKMFTGNAASLLHFQLRMIKVYVSRGSKWRKILLPKRKQSAIARKNGHRWLLFQEPCEHWLRIDQQSAKERIRRNQTAKYDQ